MLATFHLARWPNARAALRASLAASRQLNDIRGLRFARAFGTGRGREFGVRADLRRAALLTVWDEEAAAETFLESPIARRWGSEASEAWQVRLRPVRAHGSWDGELPLGKLNERNVEGLVAILTYGRLKSLSKGLRFFRALPAPNRAVQQASGLLDAVGLGQVGSIPYATAATFSLWRSLADSMTFAYRTEAHAGVVQRSRDEQWSETFFARFEPYGSEGTWDGRDALSSADAARASAER